MSGPVLVPIQLECFVLNPSVCNAGGKDDNTARIAPITQPNYTFLRLNNFLLQSDVQNHADLHNAAPASLNSRLTDLGVRPKPKLLRRRNGVYVHWTLPRFYRTAPASTDAVPVASQVGGGNKPSAPPSGSDSLVEPPTRWLVIRKIDPNTIHPEYAKDEFKEYEAWVIESDHLWSLDNIPLDYDLQLDVSPFVLATPDEKVDIKQQAEVFIGRKVPLEQWIRGADLNRTPAARPPSISLLRSSNQLFADFQMHNSNVFSMLDNFQYGDTDEPKFLDAVKASYYMVGWHWEASIDPFWTSSSSKHEKTLDALFMHLKTEESKPEYRDPWLEGPNPERLVCHGAMYDVNWNFGKKPATVPADEFARRLRDNNLPAISVGTTPMDALISYCSSRKGKDKSDVAELEEHILAIYSLLHARDDGVEGQRKAKDTIYNWSFNRSPGGTRHFMAADEKTNEVSVPDPNTRKSLRLLNQQQAQLDASRRTLLQYR
jgi:hypothetical protein